MLYSPYRFHHVLRGDTFDVTDDLDVAEPLPVSDAQRSRIGDRQVIATVSGGKDSVAMWLWARRNGLNPVAVYADTQWVWDEPDAIGATHYQHLELLEARIDQLNVIVDHLKKTPNSRRAVLQMWNCNDDLMKMDTSKDVCCNLTVMFALMAVNTGPCAYGDEYVKYLDMTVTNRINDLIPGTIAKGRAYMIDPLAGRDWDDWS